MGRKRGNGRLINLESAVSTSEAREIWHPPRGRGTLPGAGGGLYKTFIPTLNFVHHRGGKEWYLIITAKERRSCKAKGRERAGKRPSAPVQ